MGWRLTVWKGREVRRATGRGFDFVTDSGRGLTKSEVGSGEGGRGRGKKTGAPPDLVEVDGHGAVAHLRRLVIGAARGRESHLGAARAHGDAQRWSNGAVGGRARVAYHQALALQHDRLGVILRAHRRATGGQQEEQKSQHRRHAGVTASRLRQRSPLPPPQPPPGHRVAGPVTNRRVQRGRRGGSERELPLLSGRARKPWLCLAWPRLRTRTSPAPALSGALLLSATDGANGRLHRKAGGAQQSQPAKGKRAKIGRSDLSGAWSHATTSAPPSPSPLLSPHNSLPQGPEFWSFPSPEARGSKAKEWRPLEGNAFLRHTGRQRATGRKTGI